MEGGNRREARAILADKFPGWHPLLQMAKTAQDTSLSDELQFSAAKEVQQYLMPKLRSIEVTSDEPLKVELIDPSQAVAAVLDDA